MLTRLNTRKVEIPNEEGAWAEIKPASYRDIELAQDENQTKAVQKANKYQGSSDLIPEVSPEVMKVILEAAETNPLAGLDRTVLLTRCIVRWSYADEVTQELVEDLDEPTARFLAEQIWPRRGEAGKDAS